jgi:hypothetical protein
MRMGRKSSWEGEQWIIAQKESEGGKNRDKKIVMVDLIILEEKKNHQVQEPQKFSLLVKDLELFLRCPILVLAYKQKLLCGLTR